MFDDKYFPLKKNGVFGWTLLTYVADLSTPKKTGPSFGLFAPGYLWVDDVSMERVGAEVKLTDVPQRGSAHRAAGPARSWRGELPALPVPQHAGVEEVLCLR